MYNALTIDVEDYYMVSAFADVIKFEDWHRYESRIEIGTSRILDLLSEHEVKATFFILGWVGENYPKLIKNIHSAGHEVACHGYNHRLIYNMTPDEFREDVRRAKGILEDVTGEPVTGYRAASYSLVKETLWALDILMEEGFVYDSSIFPVYHDRYGIPGATRFPHAIKRNGGVIHEFPPSTYRLFRFNIPVAGGGYLRLLPIWAMERAISGINERHKCPAIIYVHPWEMDAEQPRLEGRLLSRVRHYLNLESTVHKVRHFLSKFRFKPLAHLYHGE